MSLDAGRRRFLAKRRNERLKLAAGALDRLGTVTIAGAILGPVFQGQTVETWATVGWIAVAIILHIVAQAVLTAMRDEA